MASDSKVVDGKEADSLPKGLRSNEALHDPFDWYHNKRSTAPIQHDPNRGVYDVFSYELVKKGLQDNKALCRPQLTEEETDDPLSYFDTGMVWSDGPSHKQVKGELFQYFSPRMLQGIEDSIVSITESQLDTATADTGELDLVEDFAVPVPLRVIMDFIGIPQDDHEQLLEWLETFRSVMTSEDSDKASIKGGHMAGAAEYFKGLVDERQANPQNDLISQLSTETELTPEEIGSNCFDFALAGQGTMSELLTNAVYILDQRNYISEIDDYNLSVVLEEILRYRSPLQARARRTTNQITLGETTIPADETVILWIGAANRDPEKFEDPDIFDPYRDPDHLAFGSGSHNCIGAPIARLEAPIVLETLFDRLPQVDIDYSNLIPKPKASKLGFDKMPVQFSSSPS
ncbi:cytochrome P450 [Halonotius sp. F2-221B]|mgnify:FL=1|uniref:cytochrome P450 n=1 Tax=Halonotius sp. F2-221B TaxID=2731620 RepID=UPI00398B3BE1